MSRDRKARGRPDVEIMSGYEDVAPPGMPWGDRLARVLVLQRAEIIVQQEVVRWLGKREPVED